MPDVVLDISVSKTGSDTDTAPYRVEFSLDHSDDDAGYVKLSSETHFPFAVLRRIAGDVKAYGALLAKSLFADSKLSECFVVAEALAQQFDMELRLRLTLDGSDLELHRLHWEKLTHPTTGETICTNTNILFSRMPTLQDYRTIHMRPTTKKRALVVIANPTDIEGYAPSGRRLTQIDIVAERQRAIEGFKPVPAKVLASTEDGPLNKPTLNNIIIHLEAGYEVLYLICHGAIRPAAHAGSDSEAHVYLEDDQGLAHIVQAHDFAIRLKELKYLPMVVVLASCASAGNGTQLGDSGELAALGPLLAAAGVPAVLAMQGNIHVISLNVFMPAFFSNLAQRKQIDRAVAFARGRVRDQTETIYKNDSWMPVLYLRLKSGRVGYYDPEMNHPTDPASTIWNRLLTTLGEGTCIPILGPGLNEPIIGSYREIVARIPEANAFKMGNNYYNDFPQVVQYLTVHLSESKLRSELRDAMRCQIGERFADRLDAGILRDTLPVKGGRELAESARANLKRLFSEAGKECRRRDPQDAYKILAALMVPVYVTTNPDDLLEDALEETIADLQQICIAIVEFAKQLNTLLSDVAEMIGQNAFVETAQIQAAAIMTRLQRAMPLPPQQRLDDVRRSFADLNKLVEDIAGIPIFNLVYNNVVVREKARQLQIECDNNVGRSMKSPEREFARWRFDIPIKWPSPLAERIKKEPKKYVPTFQRPIVCHMFGHLDVPESVVITEDNYFDFLISVNRADNPIYDEVNAALSDYACLFLGFGITDWHFRVLYRFLEGREGQMSKSHTHIAVQVDPAESGFANPDAARSYLHKKFRNYNIAIYWGSIDDFVKELSEQWREEFSNELALEGATL